MLVVHKCTYPLHNVLKPSNNCEHNTRKIIPGTTAHHIPLFHSTYAHAITISDVATVAESSLDLCTTNVVGTAFPPAHVQ